MAMTPSRIKDAFDVWGKHYVETWEFTADTSYPLGGYAIAPADVGLKKIFGAEIIGGNAAYGKRGACAWDNPNGKLMFIAGSGGGIKVYHEADIKGSGNTDSENVDTAAAATNSTLISALATFTAIGEGGTLAIAAQPDIPRNLLIEIRNDSGGALNLFNGVTTFAVVGTFRGVAQTENITYTSTPANQSIANTKFRQKYGVKPFDRITSITVTNIGAGGLKVSVGPGSKIGLPWDPLTGADADMLKFTKTAVDLAVAGLTSFTNNTVNFGALVDNDDITVEYNTSGEFTAGTDLSALVVRVRFVGI